MVNLIIASALIVSNLKTEVQVNLCENYSTLSTQLDLKSWNKKKSEEIFFVENRSLFLYNRGWIFKVKIDNENATATITLKKNQAMDSSEMTLKDAENKNCEYDLHGKAKKLACKLNNEMSLDKFNGYIQNHEFFSLLSRRQSDWLNEEALELPNDLIITTAFRDQDYILEVEGIKFVLGVTVNSTNQEFIEISTRADSQNEINYQKKILEYLKSLDVKICENQNSMMTKSKLESYFQ